MAKETRAEYLVRILKNHGWREIRSKSRKYRTFEHPDYPYKYFVGKHGALRRGKNVSSSISVTRLIW